MGGPTYYLPHKSAWVNQRTIYPINKAAIAVFLYMALWYDANLA